MQKRSERRRALQFRHGGWWSARALTLALVTLGMVGTVVAGPCDVDYTIDVSPRVPMDGGTLTYTLEFCDPTGDGASIGSTFIGVTRSNFVPMAGEWLSCPRGGCGEQPPDGSMTVGGFTLASNECVTFQFTLQLQPGLGGQRVCIQGTTSVSSNSPPPSPFPCNKRSTDPGTIVVQDPTCVTVEDPAPGCDIDASIDPPFLQTCAGSGDTLTCNATATGCPGGDLEYAWTRDGNAIPVSGPVITIPASEPPGGSQFRCLVSCQGLPECLAASIPAQVTIFGSAASIIVDPVSGCVGTDVDVRVIGSFGCTIDCGNGSPAVNTCTHTCTYNTPGRFPLAITSDDGNCVITEERPIDIFDQPTACIDNLISVCETAPGGPTVLNLSNCSAAGLDYTWTTTLGAFDNPRNEEPILTLPDVDVPTSVTVGLSVADPAGCGAPDNTQVMFELLPSPTATASAAPGPYCNDEEIFFLGIGTGGPGPFDFDWDFGDSNTSMLQNPTHSYAAAGVYDVWMTATDTAGGCDDDDMLQVTIEECDTCAAVIPVVGGLLAVQSTTDLDVEIQWQTVAEATDGYNVWAVVTKQEIPFAVAPGGGGVRGVCTPSVVAACIDPGVVPAGGDDLIYYQARGLCGLIEGE